jgi:hypothetical protein
MSSLDSGKLVRRWRASSPVAAGRSGWSAGAAQVLSWTVDHVAGDASRRAFCRAVCTGAEVVYLCLNAPYDRWAEELPPLQEAVLAGAEAASSKLVVLENLYMYGPHDGPLTESLPHAATDAKGVTRSRMSDALLAAHRSGRVRIAHRPRQ